MAGPFYNGPLHNQDFLNILLHRVATASKNQFGTLERMIGMVGLISEEVVGSLFYYSLAHLSSTLHCNTPSKDAIQ